MGFLVVVLGLPARPCTSPSWTFRAVRHRCPAGDDEDREAAVTPAPAGC